MALVFDFDVLAEHVSTIVVQKLRAELPAMIQEALEQALKKRETDHVGGARQLAQWIGSPSANAARAMAYRHPELAGLAIMVGGRKRWRKSEVEAWMGSRSVRAREELTGEAG